MYVDIGSFIASKTRRENLTLKSCLLTESWKHNEFTGSYEAAEFAILARGCGICRQTKI